MNFDQAFEILVSPSHEGGYVNDPKDPGGETKYGISKRSYPMEDIPNMSLERAKFLYKRDFWGTAGCDVVPEALRFHLFDFAVNSGPKTAIKELQTAVGTFPDGIIGPKTLGAISSMDLRLLIIRFSLNRLEFMTERKNWPDHGRGWTRRMIANMRKAL
jgi:lysozyme family protein